MKFEFATAGRILFGSGSSEQLPSLKFTKIYPVFAP